MTAVLCHGYSDKTEWTLYVISLLESVAQRLPQNIHLNMRMRPAHFCSTYLSAKTVFKWYLYVSDNNMSLRMPEQIINTQFICYLTWFLNKDVFSRLATGQCNVHACIKGLAQIGSKVGVVRNEQFITCTFNKRLLFFNVHVNFIKHGL